MHIGFASAVIAALNGIVKQAENAVAIVLIIFSSIDATLRGNGVRAARRILVAECFYLVAQFTQRRSGTGAGKTSTNYNDFQLALIGGIYPILTGDEQCTL